jgi:hypothetical protein
MDLVLETKDQQNKTPVVAGGLVMMTPHIEPDYWAYRVKLSDTQAIVGFPKFQTIGIGFAVEEDWNTNLPYATWENNVRVKLTAAEIFDHIKHNKGDEAIADEDVVRAIQMVIDAAWSDREGSV